MTTGTSVVEIRDYLPADRAAVEVLVRELQGDMGPYFDRNLTPDALSKSYMDSLFQAHLDKGAILIAESDGKIVGYAMLCHGLEGDADEEPYSYTEVKELLVSQAFRGQGVGEKLLAASEEKAAGAGERWLRIALLAQNEGARALYRRFGFQDHLVIMEKPVEGRD